MSRNLSELDRLHARYRLQAEWTSALRAQILNQIQVEKPRRVLEAGSGTGAIAQAIYDALQCPVFGVDIDESVTNYAQKQDEVIHYSIADGRKLPFDEGTFDLGCSHFLLLWVDKPELVLIEMKRVVKPGCWVVAFAEPDYGARIDFPDPLAKLGAMQTGALKERGASVTLGRQLRSLFIDAGMEAVTAGVLGGEWHTDLDDRLIRSELETLQADLQSPHETAQLASFMELDRNAWRDGSRVLFVPTFYAYGRVPGRGVGNR